MSVKRPGGRRMEMPDIKGSFGTQKAPRETMNRVVNTFGDKGLHKGTFTIVSKKFPPKIKIQGGGP